MSQVDCYVLKNKRRSFDAFFITYSFLKGKQQTNHNSSIENKYKMKVFSNESKKNSQKNTSFSNSFMGATRKSPLDWSATKQYPKGLQASHVIKCNHNWLSHPEINKQQRLLVNISINKAKHARQNYKKRLNACKQFVKTKQKDCVATHHNNRSHNRVVQN